jgi:hypothetical protein
MARRILRGDEFVAAVEADVLRLHEIDRTEWCELLASDIRDVERLISVFPQAGTLVATRDTRELRKKVLRRTPFVVFYDFEPGRRAGPIRLVWLVHQRARARKRFRW